LLAPRRTLIGQIGNDGRGVEQLVIATARNDLGTTILGLLHNAVDIIALALIDHRTDRDILFGGIAQWELLSLLLQRCDIFFGNPLVHQVTSGGLTSLTPLEART